MKRALGAVVVAVMALASCDSGSDQGETFAPAVDEATTTTAPQSTTATTSFTMTIDPVSGPAGTTIRVRGSGCPSPGGALTAIAKDGEEQEGAQPGNPGPSGQWMAEFSIPDAFPADARYEVTAVCYSSPGVVAFSYMPVPFDVT
jgi:hypothetical protein